MAKLQRLEFVNMLLGEIGKGKAGSEIVLSTVTGIPCARYARMRLHTNEEHGVVALYSPAYCANTEE